MRIKNLLVTTLLLLSLVSVPAGAQAPDPKEAELKQKVQANPKDAEALIALGQYYYNAYKDEEALKVWEKVLPLNPSDPAEVYFKMSQSYRYLKKTDKALEAAHKAVALKPDNAIYLNAVGVLHFQNNNIAEALSYYQKAIALKGDYSAFYDNVAKAHLLEEKYDDARKAAEKALSLQADDAVAHYLLGKIDLNEEKYESALAHFKTSLSYDAKSYDTYYDQGIAYHYLEDYEQSENSLRQALALNTDPTQRLHYWLGIALIFQKENEKVREGIEYLKQQVAFDGSDTAAHDRLGFAYWRLGQFQNAIEQYLQVLKVQYNDAETNYYLGSSYLGAGTLNLAADYLKKAVDLAPQFYAAHVELGYTYYKQQRYAEALAKYNQALAVAPKKITSYADIFNPPDVVHYRMALVHRDEKHYTDCVIETDKAIALYADDYSFYAVKGDCLLANDKAPAALEQLKKAIAMKPDNEYVNYNIARAYLKLNDSASATKHYDFLRQIQSDYADELQPVMGTGAGQSF